MTATDQTYAAGDSSTATTMPDGVTLTEGAASKVKALLDGDITGEEGDTFEAGDLGEFEIGADGVVLLGEPFTFDADNIGDFDF